jgi:peptidoglycan/LPS O-acetylase OafA/YrhL
VVSHLLFIHNATPSTSGSINGPNWSVALEVQFYVLIAFATPWLARTAWWRVLLVWVGIAIAWRYGTTWIWVPGQTDVNAQRVAATQLPGTLDQFGCGVCLAKLALSGHLEFSRRRFATALAIAVAALTASWLIFWPRANYWYLPEMVVYWRTLLSAGLAALLACVVMIPGAPGVWSRPFRYLGEISYGLYLWHLPVLLTLLDKTPWKGVRLLTVTFLLTTVLAALSWHGFEKLWMKPRKRDASSRFTAPALQ